MSLNKKTINKLLLLIITLMLVLSLTGCCYHIEVAGSMFTGGIAVILVAILAILLVIIIAAIIIAVIGIAGAGLGAFLITSSVVMAIVTLVWHIFYWIW